MKVLIVGRTATGKTTLLKKFVGTFYKKPTIIIDDCQPAVYERVRNLESDCNLVLVFNSVEYAKSIVNPEDITIETSPGGNPICRYNQANIRDEPLANLAINLSS